MRFNKILISPVSTVLDSYAPVRWHVCDCARASCYCSESAQEPSFRPSHCRVTGMARHVSDWTESLTGRKTGVSCHSKDWYMVYVCVRTRAQKKIYSSLLNKSYSLRWERSTRLTVNSLLSKVVRVSCCRCQNINFHLLPFISTIFSSFRIN